MARKPLHCIFVGRLKQHFLQEGCTLYAERIRHFADLTIHEVRDGAAKCTREERQQQEGKHILACLTEKDIPFVLDEQGEQLTSLDWARLLQDSAQKALGTPCFIVGGAFGVSSDVRQKARKILALGMQTLPHELARLVLLEQLYRAHTILSHTPYHH